eukprot:Em0001g402a
MEEGLSVGQANGARNHDDWLMTASSASSPIVICDDGTGEEGIIMGRRIQTTRRFRMSGTKPPSAGNSKQQRGASTSTRGDTQRCGTPPTHRGLGNGVHRAHRTLVARLRLAEAQETAQIVWNLLKDKDLKKKLKDYHLLPLEGTCKDMIQRLQEFSLRYNAQCDLRITEQVRSQRGGAGTRQMA